MVEYLRTEYHGEQFSILKEGKSAQVTVWHCRLCGESGWVNRTVMNDPVIGQSYYGYDSGANPPKWDDFVQSERNHQSIGNAKLNSCDRSPNLFGGFEGVEEVVTSQAIEAEFSYLFEYE